MRPTRVGLLRVDGRRDRRTGVVFPNLALMKYAAHYKAQGAEIVRDPRPLDGCDLVIRSKVFTPSEKHPDDETVYPCETISGGTGYDLSSALPDEVEAMCPDYGLYPESDFALGFTSRGCVRRCPFCVVPTKEGKVRPVGDLSDFWRGQRVAKLLDNNLTALPDHLEKICLQSRELNVGLDVTQGFDARLITPEIAEVMRRAKWANYPHVAFDSVGVETGVVRGIKALLDAGFPKTHLMVYVLINFGTTYEEDLYRLRVLRPLGVRPFVMVYGDTRDLPQDKKRLVRWANRPVIWGSTDNPDEVVSHYKKSS